MLVVDISYLELWLVICSVERNHFSPWARRDHHAPPKGSLGVV